MYVILGGCCKSCFIFSSDCLIAWLSGAYFPLQVPLSLGGVSLGLYTGFTTKSCSSSPSLRSTPSSSRSRSKTKWWFVLKAAYFVTSVLLWVFDRWSPYSYQVHLHLSPHLINGFNLTPPLMIYISLILCSFGFYSIYVLRLHFLKYHLTTLTFIQLPDWYYDISRDCLIPLNIVLLHIWLCSLNTAMFMFMFN